MSWKKIYLIDWNSFIYRMFFGLPEFMSPQWEVVNAVFWMAKFFVKQLVQESPDYVVFITDAPWKNFRNDLYTEYKATRERMPDNLRSQITWIHELIHSMWIDIISIPWYEADDVIWTIAHMFSWNDQYDIDILTGDKDLYSLVSSNVSIYDTMKKKRFGITETEEKFWVKPEYIIDYLAIVWDKADNIPWIDWFGPKKAIDLIKEIWWIKEIYDTVDLRENNEINILEKYPKVFSYFKGKTYEKLVSSKKNAHLSKRLATIELNVNIDNFDIENFTFHDKNILNEIVIDSFKKYGFNSLLWKNEISKKERWSDVDKKVTIISNKKQLEVLLQTILHDFTEIVIDTETTSLDVSQALITWISICLWTDDLYYINRMHDWLQIEDKDLFIFLSSILESDTLLIWHNIKYDLQIINSFLFKKCISTVIEKKIKNENTWEQTSLVI